MRVQIIPCDYPPTWGWPISMAQGIAAAGDNVTISKHYRASGFDAYVMWGLKRRHYRQCVRDGKKNLVIIERGYLGERMRDWLSVGIGGINGMADFCNADVPPDRWERYWKQDVQPWRTTGDYALIIGQVKGDAALYGMDPYQWAGEAAREALQYYGRVYFRPHPDCRVRRDIKGAETLGGPLDDALDGAAVVITYSSNVGVVAAMRGTPVVAMFKGSMAWDVSSHSISAEHYLGNRDDWGRRLAYTQWTQDEMASGEAWRHIRRGLV
jgi:hypothetical protein